MTLSFLSLFALFGGFLAFLRALANYCLRDFQNFSLTNSMIKKLYTEVQEEDYSNKGDGDTTQNFDELLTPEEAE